MIYQTKGAVNSVLINLENNELRTINTNRLLDDFEGLDDGGNLNYHFQYLECYDFSIIDLYLLNPDNNFLEQFEFHESAVNIRIIISNCTSNIESGVKNLLNNILNNNLFLGLIFMTDNLDINKAIINLFPSIIVVNLEPKNSTRNSKSKLFKPQFLSTPFAIFLSRNNNLYYHSRHSMLIRGSEIEILDNLKNNIPKKKIRICSVCEYREVCLDNREVLYDGAEHYYEDECAYNPYTGEWRDEM